MNALVLTDIQNDFCAGGALAVPDGDAIVSLANRLIPCFDIVLATLDWHPADHGSFAVNHPGRNTFELIDLGGLPQVLWPTHCVQWTGGAQFHPELNTRGIARIFPKGLDPQIDSYSGFFDNGRKRSTGLGEWLKDRGITEVAICGLTTDYCVKATACDATSLGLRALLIQDACRGVGLRPGDIPEALDAMRRAGVILTESAAFLPQGVDHVTGHPND
jgi:nicotinamidase/pyrazinamidase